MINGSGLLDAGSAQPRPCGGAGAYQPPGGRHTGLLRRAVTGRTAALASPHPRRCGRDLHPLLPALTVAGRGLDQVRGRSCPVTGTSEPSGLVGYGTILAGPGEVDHPAGDVDRVGAETLVEARHQRHLHRHRQRHPP